MISISVPDVPEINSRVERVSAKNNIDLPVAGEIKVGGLTEDQAREAIRTALAKLVKDPDVNLFVKEYKSRQVAVVGMVNRPGLYSLNSRSDTILDLIGRAGGMNERASNVVMLVPAPPSSNGRIPSSVLENLHDQRRNAAQSTDSKARLGVQTAGQRSLQKQRLHPIRRESSKLRILPYPKAPNLYP